MPFQQHVKAFQAFAKSHFTGSHDGPIQLKIDHSLRVVENASLILAHEALDEHTTQICRLAALYHDIGRFPQYQQYGTFKDAQSINHGRLGIVTLRSLDLPPDDLDESDWRTIRIAVAQHNVLELNPSLPNQYALPTKVVRDADKLDIYQIMTEHLTAPGQLDPVVTGGAINAPSRYSEAIFTPVFNGEMGKYSDITYANDFKLLLLSWIFSFNFVSSLELLFKRGYVQKLFSTLPDDPQIRAFEKKAIAYMHYKTHVGS